MSNLNPQQFLYHVTPAYNKESIIHQGLDPRREPNEWDFPVERKVYLTPSLKDAHSWATQIELVHNTDTPMSLFKVNVAGLKPESRETDIGLNEYTVSHPIEKTRISHIKDFKTSDKIEDK